ncbi:MAG: helicase HerA domain-containing protein [Lachnospiraceae bacterium]
MLNEFYNYIASNTLSFFQAKSSIMQPGERYCLKLDNEEMVAGVDCALRKITEVNDIQGKFDYEMVYSTFTIKLSDSLEVVVASKINGMTDDFLATLRNAELTENHFPILMITYSAIDTITSGTGDLAANGMPFHATSIIAKIKEDIKNAQLSVRDKTLLEMELSRKQMDHFSDKSSLYEYADLLTVLGRGYVKERDYPSFCLLPDPNAAHLVDSKKIRERFQENYKLFELINRVVKHGNIADDLEKEFDKSFIDYLQACKRKNIPWYEDEKCTYDMVKSSQDKLKKKLDNPLEIVDSNFEVYSGSPLEYRYESDELFFMRDDGNSKIKRRRKNILIYNPDKKENISISVYANINVKQEWIVTNGCEVTLSGKEVKIDIKPKGCSFSQVKIKDSNNNITYAIKICAIDIPIRYLENIQTEYLLSVPQNLKRATIQVYGLSKHLVINPGNENLIKADASCDGVYECNYNQTLDLSIGEEAIDSETGHMDCILKCGAVMVPLQIQDELVKPTEITGVGVFKRKHTEKKSLEYREERIISGTTEFFIKGQFRATLAKEKLFIENGWCAIEETVDEVKEYKLLLPDYLNQAYSTLINVLRKKRTLPSLAYYDEELFDAATKYIEAVEEVFDSVKAGDTLNTQQNHALLLGCIIKTSDEQAIAMSPLHPLNVLYQMKLMNEQDVGSVRDNLVEKLTPLSLIPFIKDTEKKLYHAIEQKQVPEWRYYAPISNKRYQGTRNFIQKLVCDKIVQYKEHFSFLFDGLGNKQLLINLVNMGDCREIFQGLLRFYVQNLKDNVDPDDLLNFVINIYTPEGMVNEFTLLSDQHQLKEYIKAQYPSEDVGELVLIMTGKIRCCFRNPLEGQYQYAHLTFYEMKSSEDTGSSRMDSITTGISLHGLVSGIPSVLNSGWYKTGFGLKYAEGNQLARLAAYYNAMYRVAFSGSSYEPNSCIFTEIEQGQEEQLGKIYSSSNWVVFVDPKVDLSFFQKKSSQDDNVMIIHYSDQYTSSSGYDDITVTQKSDQYSEIIFDQLQKKGVTAGQDDIKDIISLFNAINGGWLLRLITAKKLSGAADSYFSREKMSILSAIKVCMAYYVHSDIVWIPVSLEEMLRVSGGAGLSQKEGILSAKNLGFEQRATSDDILLVGVEGPEDHIKIYIHPVEVKIGQNSQGVLDKANSQVLNTYTGLWNALWPREGKDTLERKMSRNFFIQLLIVSCEKLKLYEIYPDIKWDDILKDYREKLLNEQYEFSDEIDQYIGKGTIISFGTDVLNKQGNINEDVCLLEFPEKMGSSYMVLSASEIEQDLERDAKNLPDRLKTMYKHTETVEKKKTESVISNTSEENCKVTIPAKETDIYQPPTKLLKVVESAVEYGTLHKNESEEASEVTTEKKIVGMSVLLGTDVSSGSAVYWYPNDTNKLFHTNTGIIGTMGTGKTQFTKSLITQLHRDQEHNIGSEPLGILIFDYKGDYNESKEDFVKATDAKVLKPYHLPFNPLALTKANVFKPLLPIHVANAFKDTLAKVYGLGPKQQNILFQCIIDAYASRGIMPGNSDTWDNTPPTFDMVYNLYSNDQEIKKNDSLAAAMDKLYQFQVFEGNSNKTQALFELLQGVVVIDLSGYDSDIQSLIVAITLDLFYSQMQAAGSSKLEGQYRQLSKLILVDEADNFMSEGFPALKKILKEGREFGVGTILSTQFLRHFGTGDDDYAKYILTWVVHNVADLKSSDVEFVFKTEPKSAESQNLYNDIKELKKHHSIIKIGNEKPIYVEDKAFWELYKDLKLD